MLFSIAIGAYLVQTFKKFFGGVSGNPGMVPTSSSIGRLLLGDMVLFEVVSLVLLAALVELLSSVKTGKGNRVMTLYHFGSSAIAIGIYGVLPQYSGCADVH